MSGLFFKSGKPPMTIGLVVGLAIWGIPDCASAQSLKRGTDTNYIQVYGQVDKGFLLYDDGSEQNFYPGVDNDSSSTRFGVRAYDLDENGWAFGANAEFEWELYSTGYVNVYNKHDFEIDAVELRKAEVFIEHSAFGKLWAGHGSMASDGTSEIDLSGTSLAGYASVGDIAGGQLFRYSDGTISDIAIYDAFSDLDGLGRKSRVRYDTPNLNGFVLGTSMDRDGDWDVAMNYSGDFGDVTLAAEAAYSSVHDFDQNTVNGSLSVLHNPSGISMTFAAGREMESDSKPEFIYGKLGYQTQWFDVGKTYLSIDVYSGGDQNVAGSDSNSYGFAMVQDLDDYSLQYYLGLRAYQYDNTNADFRDGGAAIIGARYAF